MKVLVACEFSGRVRDAFLKRGHDAISCDLLPSESPGPHYQGDVKDILYSENFDLLIGHPPCTYLTCTGNKWNLPEYEERFPLRRENRKEAMAFFLELVNAPIPRIAIENPIGIMSTHYREPDQIIQPCEFGHNVRKSTCLWLKNLPLLKPTQIVSPELHQMKNGWKIAQWYIDTMNIRDLKKRSKARSRTFSGIAEAFADQWGSCQTYPIQSTLEYFQIS